MTDQVKTIVSIPRVNEGCQHVIAFNPFQTATLTAPLGHYAESVEVEVKLITRSYPKCDSCNGLGHIVLFTTFDPCSRCAGKGYIID